MVISLCGNFHFCHGAINESSAVGTKLPKLCNCVSTLWVRCRQWQWVKQNQIRVPESWKLQCYLRSAPFTSNNKSDNKRNPSADFLLPVDRFPIYTLRNQWIVNAIESALRAFARAFHTTHLQNQRIFVHVLVNTKTDLWCSGPAVSSESNALDIHNKGQVSEVWRCTHMNRFALVFGRAYKVRIIIIRHKQVVCGLRITTSRMPQGDRARYVS